MPHLRLAAPVPTRPGILLPRRDLAVGWVLIVLIAALAWLLTIGQSRRMGMEPGTMGPALPLFLVLWVVMMVAMMLPSVAPVAITWVRAIGRNAAGGARAFRITEFVGGYLLAWTGFGLLAYGALAATGSLVDSHPGAGRWIGAGAFLLAGLQQFGPLKRVCLRHCRNPMFQLLRYSRFRPWAKDLRVGLHHGLYCVGCCWGLMIVLIPLGFMNVAAMAGLAAVIFLEKLWRSGPWLSWAVGLVFLVLAALAPFQDWLLPGLEMSEPSMEPMSQRPVDAPSGCSLENV
jgi:predicted metal-binding membrane protein